MIEVKGLVKTYGEKRAVDGVSFTVRRGDILGFLGPNGAGKSTTMKMITGFLRPDAGAAFVDGVDVAANPVAVKAKLGYLPENAPAYPEMTVEEFLGFIAEVRGFRSAADRRAQVDRATALTHLNPVRKQTIETLSKGYKQRVGFAQALLHDPQALVLDEPTDGLDPRLLARELSKVLPDGVLMTLGAGHFFSFPAMYLSLPDNAEVQFSYHFGAVGQGLPVAIGVGAGHPGRPHVAIEGDGSLMMHVQELETIRRQGIKMLMAIMNDGGYGAEVHKFRANGITAKEAVHGRGDLAAAATGFGLRGASVTQPGRYAPLFKEHQGANIGSLWDIHIDDLIPSRAYRRVHYGEA